jgi:hypothetical protein
MGYCNHGMSAPRFAERNNDDHQQDEMTSVCSTSLTEARMVVVGREPW